MGERHDAKRSIESARESMSEIADELVRRASPQYVKQRVKEAAVTKTSEVRERAMVNPWFFPVVGGTLGVMIGRAVGQQIRERRAEAPRYRGDGYRREAAYGEPYAGYLPTEAEEERGRLREKAESVKEGVREAGEKVSEKTAHLRERMPSREELGGRMRESAGERPFLWALGATVLGALFGVMVPLSEKERRTLGAAKEKAEEQIKEMGTRAAEATRAMAEGAQKGFREEPRPETPPEVVH